MATKQAPYRQGCHIWLHLIVFKYLVEGPQRTLADLEYEFGVTNHSQAAKWARAAVQAGLVIDTKQLNSNNKWAWVFTPVKPMAENHHALTQALKQAHEELEQLRAYINNTPGIRVVV